MSPERECISSEELIKILNFELAKYRECADCQFVGPIRQLTTPYADGGNWFRSLTVRGRPQDPHACGETAAEVVVLVAQRYNLVLCRTQAPLAKMLRSAINANERLPVIPGVSPGLTEAAGWHVWLGGADRAGR